MLFYIRLRLCTLSNTAEPLQKIVNSAIVCDHMETVHFAIVAITWFSDFCDPLRSIAIVCHHMETRLNIQYDDVDADSCYRSLNS